MRNEGKNRVLLYCEFDAAGLCGPSVVLISEPTVAGLRGSFAILIGESAEAALKKRVVGSNWQVSHNQASEFFRDSNWLPGR